MEWWKTLYSTDDYLTIFSPYLTNEKTCSQVDFIAKNLPLHLDDKILDLCCGVGRHALELARRGYQVVGVDWSNNYLEVARQMAQRENLAVEFVQQDMRNIDYKNSFDVVINMFTSFGYFDNEDDNEKAIRQIAQALKPGGLFFFDFINLSSLLRFPPSTIWHQDEQTQAIIIRERHLDLFKWRLDETCTVFRMGIKHEYMLSYRLYTLAEFLNLLGRCGLKFQQAFGDFDGCDCCENFPPRMIVISRKKSEASFA